jgi:hypothetical protein
VHRSLTASLTAPLTRTLTRTLVPALARSLGRAPALSELCELCRQSMLHCDDCAYLRVKAAQINDVAGIFLTARSASC